MTVRRDLRVDAVRGVALVSMYLAHCAPTAGPGKVVDLTEYATYPLFALLVGMGAELGRGSAPDRWWVSPLVRGALLLLAADLLELLSAQIYVVLAFLGVLTWLTAPLARAGTVAVGVVGLVALAVAPTLNGLAGHWAPSEFPFGRDGHDLFEFLVVGGPGFAGPYQLAAMVVFAAIGILLARHALPVLGNGALLAAGLGFGAVSAVWFGLHQSGSFEVAAYDVTYRVLAFDVLLVVATTLAASGMAGLVPRLAAPLAAMGAMSLTLYCLQFVWLHVDYHVFDHLSDDNWRNVAVLTLGSAAFALAWRAAVGLQPWRRGPLEGPVAALVRQLSVQRVCHPSGQASARRTHD